MVLAKVTICKNLTGNYWVKLANAQDVKEIKSPDGEVSIDCFNEKDIQYKEYTLIREGIISHDELLVIASYMFKTYVKLCDIIKDKFKFILIDEYQDTSPYVISIFLEYLKQSNKKNTIGFFGDAMQSIYDDTIGNLNAYIEAGDVVEVKKEQNRRNPKLVYELANKLRTDGIVQRASSDCTAPNMAEATVKQGSINFYYSVDQEKLDDIKELLGWDFSDSKETRILNLTHNLIAPKAGFTNLMAIYDGDKILDYKKRVTDYIKNNNISEDFTGLTFGQVIEKLIEGKKTQAERRPVLPTPAMQTFIDGHPELYDIATSYPFEDFRRIYVYKDALLDDKKDDEDESRAGSKRDNLIKHLFKIQTNINLYTQNKYNEFLRKTEFRIQSIADKRRLKEIISQLKAMSENTIEDVIEYAHDNGICRKDDKLLGFIEKKRYVYDRGKTLKFQEFQNLFFYLEGYTPFSTQHKIKGAEFDNVLVVLDNGNWSKYNFKYLFENNGTDSVRERTQKLFYVCCTRSKENLTVYYHNPSQVSLETAKSWFGEDNVHEL